MPDLESRHDLLLNAIEDVERLSLRWGDVDASLSRDEVIELAAPLFVGGAEEAVETLLATGLLYEFNLPSAGARYRSRFAEMLRLLSRMRQIFPQEAWRGAPPLVADYRLDLRARRYPRRDVSSEAVLASRDDLTEVQRAVWRALAPGTLAAFQERAAERLLATTGQDFGVIVGAGTGSGKTLAFYLPVFVRLAALVRSGEFWTKAIAIYPRNELLKDQLTEAYRNARAVAGVLSASGTRPLRLAAFYGDTPQRAAEKSLPKTWLRRRGGYVCPFLRCDCGGDMMWSTEDLNASVERLRCIRECGHVTDPNLLVLTRARLRGEPPDLLFTTTEMLNRSLSDQRRRTLFGVRAPKGRRPEFLLLDEAHTYTGIPGAQAALTLRRWRHLVGGPIAWVGLSATLEQAARFFSQLTGVDAAAVSEVTPDETELVEEGREYQIALRGDPAARAALLSTSIQTAMLLGRVLDPPAAPSEGRFGKRLFVFTDDLDVTHRLFDSLRDAEAFDRFGRPDPQRAPLAVLRAQTVPGQSETESERRARDADGQRWRVVEEIGRNLADRLHVARTTSRDPGVDAGANVIVATAALEVGFNDPNVGAVLQHKSPRDFASFVQRRGRAGRDRLMRPLTVTVLSDYGRDRQIFQAAEHLFDPTLPPQSLPVRNEYVLRMQAVFALLDWIADQARPQGVPTGSVWRTAAEPSSPDWDDRAWRAHIVALLAEVLRGDTELRRSLRAHIRLALQVDDLGADRLLWEAPRSLLLEVAPTLLRRMHRDWKLGWPSANRTQDRWIPDHPLPDFAPRALFADLNLPELEIVVPGARAGDPDVHESLPLQQGLMQLAPGRVTRRFGDAFGGLAHWSSIPAGVVKWDLPVSAYAEEAEFLGVHRGLGEHGWTEAAVYRPWRVKLARAPENVIGVTSNATLTWASEFTTNGGAVEIAAPAKTAWRGFVTAVELYLHRFRASVGVRRFATGARAELRRPGGVDQVVDVSFRTTDGAPAAVGFDFETDGLAVRLQLPSTDDMASAPLDAPLGRSLRASLHRFLVARDPDFPRELNGFVRAWLRQVHFLCCADRALNRGETLGQAAAALAEAGPLAPYSAILDVLLGVQRVGLSEAEDDAVGSDNPSDDTGEDARPQHDRLERLKSKLRDCLAEPQVRDRLFADLVSALDDTSPARSRYIRLALQGTLADALLAAASSAAPRQAAADALIADIEFDETAPSVSTIWLTETTVGGAGVLQSVADRFSAEPRLIFRGVEAALEPTDLEVAAGALARTYRLALEDAAVAEAIAAVRAELGHQARSTARATLLAELERRGVETSRAFVVALGARMLAPGIRTEHDDLVRRLLDFWEEAERKIEFELEPREVAVLAADDSGSVELGVRAGLFDVNASAADRALAIGSLLWPRSHALHRQTLASWNPFRGVFPCEPALVRAFLFEGARAAIAIEEPDWWDQLADVLAHDGAGRISAPLAEPGLLGTALLRLQVTPVHVGHLKLYPAIERIAKDEARISATLVLREQL